jgi:hypothetical protein
MLSMSGMSACAASGAPHCEHDGMPILNPWLVTA